VRAQLAIAYGGFAVVGGQLRHRADFDGRILFRIRLDLEDLHVARDARARGVGGIAAAPIEAVTGDAQTRRAPSGGEAIEIAATPLAGRRILLRWRGGNPVQPLEIAEQAELLRGDEGTVVRVLGRGGRVEIALRIHAAAGELRERDFERRVGGGHFTAAGAGSECGGTDEREPRNAE